MRILFIGDIFASAGRSIVAELLPSIRQTEAPDLIIANCENAAGGFGVTPQIADTLLEEGIDVLTSGNHIWDKRDINDYLMRTPELIRPANYPGKAPGNGYFIATAKTGTRCAVINLQGRTYMPPTDCPFRKADEILEKLHDVPVKFVDFHAEVTSEKIAMGWYLDGRVSAVVGTHTHIPTADSRILHNGTAYQTDCGMTGPYDSVIGVEKEAILHKFLTSLPVKMEAARGWVELRAVIVDVDENTGKATAIRRYAATHGGRLLP
jgi:2',3'-cyclic-nucleotide 2'-phosphodiesterase